MNHLKEYNFQIFESIKYLGDDSKEFWKARELMLALEYTKWSNFKKVINKAKLACELSGNIIFNHFAEVGQTIKMSKGALKQILDLKLSQYACYLIVQNGDSRKKVITFGQTYFAVQTRKQEITEEYFNSLTDNKKRVITRVETIDKNKILYKTARESGYKKLW